MNKKAASCAGLAHFRVIVGVLPFKKNLLFLRLQSECIFLPPLRKRQPFHELRLEAHSCRYVKDSGFMPSFMPVSLNLKLHPGPPRHFNFSTAPLLPNS